MRSNPLLQFGLALLVLVCVTWAIQNFIVHKNSSGLYWNTEKQPVAYRFSRSGKLDEYPTNPVESLARSNIGLQQQLLDAESELLMLRQKVQGIQNPDDSLRNQAVQSTDRARYIQGEVVQATYNADLAPAPSIDVPARGLTAEAILDSDFEPAKDELSTGKESAVSLASHTDLLIRQTVTNEKVAALEKQIEELQRASQRSNTPEPSEPEPEPEPSKPEPSKPEPSKPEQSKPEQPARALNPQSKVSQTQFESSDFDGIELEELEEIVPLPDIDDFETSEFELPVNPRRLQEKDVRAPVEELPSQEFLSDFTARVTSASLTNAETKIRWSLDDALNAALLFSYQADSLRIEPLENLQQVGIEVGAFDLAAFFETNYNDSNRPIGNSFETDGSSQRVRGEEFTFSHGLRRELRSGGQFEFREEFSTRDDDSGVLNPRDQANSQLSLSFSKEILRGSGRSIAGNEVLVAQLNAKVSSFRATGQIADLLQEVSESYWNIFAARGALLSAIDNVQATENILNDLLARRDIDAEPDLIEQARTAVIRQTVLADRAYQELASAQFTLVRLVNAPELLANRQKIEIIPIVDLDYQSGEPDIESRLNTAIHNRPEMRAVVEDIQRAQLENHLSLNELLPRLTFNSEATFEGLAGNRDLFAAARDRFDSNATYQLGFEFEMPLANRQARYRKRQVELEISRLSKDWNLAVERVKEEVLNASFSFNTNQEVVGKQRAIFRSTQLRLNDLRTRQARVPKEDSIPALQLGRLIDGQTEFGQAKADYAEALADRGRALIELNRATGILVQSEVPAISNPGKNCFIKVYHQYLEQKKEYRPFADAVTDATRFVSKKHNRTLGRLKAAWHHPGEVVTNSMGYPEPSQPVAHGMHGQPLYQSVQQSEPAYDQPMLGEPAFDQPTQGQYMHNQPRQDNVGRHDWQAQQGNPNIANRSGLHDARSNARPLFRPQQSSGMIQANWQNPSMSVQGKGQRGVVPASYHSPTTYQPPWHR